MVLIGGVLQTLCLSLIFTSPLYVFLSHCLNKYQNNFQISPRTVQCAATNVHVCNTVVHICYAVFGFVTFCV
jgi:hypothetical protein